MRMQNFDVISFDCYGTLIDWERGIGGTLLPLLASRGSDIETEPLLRLYARHEEAVEREPHRPYREVLAEVTDRIADDLGVRLVEGDRDRLARSLPSWPAFDDTVAALARLAGRYRLAILSNVDDDLFARTADALGVAFDPIVTAGQVGGYKPDRRNFQTLLARIGVAPERLLHAAQSLFHDVAPARELGIATVWVNRRGGGGATPEASARPDLEVPDLTTLADLADAAARKG